MSWLRTNPGVSWSQIARGLGCHRSTVQREVARNGGRLRYSAHAAQQRAEELMTRQVFLFDKNPQLCERVTKLLIQGYSPFAVAKFVGISHETVYQGLYSGRLGLDPQQVLRTRRPKRRHRHLRQATNSGNYLGRFSPIGLRPASVETRTEVGHWEGDLITGSANQSAIITLTERLSRFQQALRLPLGHSADHTMAALRQWITTHQPLIKTLTWDRGAELTRWTQLQDHHHISVFFCDPKSPWQRASNENANRQLRFWFPRRTNLRAYTQADMDHACHILNTTPRRIHNNHTAQELYDRHTRTDK